MNTHKKIKYVEEHNWHNYKLKVNICLNKYCVFKCTSMHLFVSNKHLSVCKLCYLSFLSYEPKQLTVGRGKVVQP